MALFSDFLQDEDDTKQQGQQPNPAGPLSAGTAAGGPSPVASTSPTPAPAPSSPASASAATAPSSFRSFQDTYSANDTGAQNAANQLAAPVQQAAQKAQAGLSGLQSTFGQGVAAGNPLQGPLQGITPQGPAAPAAAPTDYSKPYVAPAQQAYQSTGRTPTYNDVHDTVKQSKAHMAGEDDDTPPKPPKQPAPAPAAAAAPAAPKRAPTLAGTFAGGVPQSPGAGIQTPGTYTHTGAASISADEAKRRAALAYTGPAGLTDDARFAQVAKDTADAQSRLQALGTAGGRQALLQQSQAGQGYYSPGAANLDALLTGRAAGDFQGLRGQFGNLGDTFNQAVTDSKATADTARGGVAGLAQKYGDEAAAHDAALPVAPPAAPSSGLQYVAPDAVWQANHPDAGGTDDDRQNVKNVANIEDAMDTAAGIFLPGFGALKKLFGGRQNNG